MINKIKNFIRGNYEKELDKRNAHTVVISNGKAEYYVSSKKDKVDLDKKDIIKKVVWHNLLPHKTKVTKVPKPRLHNQDYEINPDGTNVVGTIGGGVMQYRLHDVLPLSRAMAERARKKDPDAVTYNILGITNNHCVADNVTISTQNRQIRKPFEGPLLFSGFARKMQIIDKYDVGLLTPNNRTGIYWVTDDYNRRERGTVSPKSNNLVFKDGRTTGHTKGKILATKVSCKINYPVVGEILMQDLVMLSRMSSGGDSGSIIRDNDTGKAVALLFAGSSQRTFAIPAGKIESEYGIYF